MLMQEPTAEMIEAWKQVFIEYGHKLYPNRKSAAEIIEYLKNNYPLIEFDDNKASQAVIENVLGNKSYKEKLPIGKAPRAITFTIEHKGYGNIFYKKQDSIFNGMDISVGIELETGFFYVEGSSILYDELIAFRGLDESDLKNYYLVAEYIQCLKMFGLLEKVLNKTK